MNTTKVEITVGTSFRGTTVKPGTVVDATDAEKHTLISQKMGVVYVEKPKTGAAAK